MTDFKNAQIVSGLPLQHLSGERNPLPTAIRGATIISIGALADREAVEGGGLVIDYQPRGSDQIHRIVLACNETGMWVEFADLLD